MVAVIRRFAIILVVTASCAIVASERKEDANSDYYNFGNEEIVLLAHTKMLRAIDKANLKSAICDEKRMETTVSARVLPSLPLSKRDWGVAFTYLAAKAMTRCDEDAVNKAFMAFARFKNIEKALMGDKILNTGFYSMELLCCLAERGKLETELQYMKIDAKIRETLEAIPELNEPFNPILTIEAMGN
ncbi:MAG: hypothetical protein OEW08_10780 [Gammaproteobacteria bacterium]|nr:hypothetical protein [Gammaproteobacteria bacterium]